jgi:hypothetical protein
MNQSNVDTLFINKNKEILNIDGIQYRTIPLFENYYVSNSGVLISLKRKNPLKLKHQKSSKSNHLYVFLYKNNKMIKCWVHRAVLSAWNRLPKENEVCRHKNDNAIDNNIGNLEWGTSQDNIRDKIKNGRQPKGESCVLHKLSEVDVFNIKQEIKHNSLRMLAKKYKVSHTAIRRAAKGIKWSHLIEGLL